MAELCGWLEGNTGCFLKSKILQEQIRLGNYITVSEMSSHTAEGNRDRTSKSCNSYKNGNQWEEERKGEKQGQETVKGIVKVSTSCDWCFLWDLLDSPWSLKPQQRQKSSLLFWPYTTGDQLTSVVKKTEVVGWWDPGLMDWVPWCHHLVGLLASASIQHFQILSDA